MFKSLYMIALTALLAGSAAADTKIAAATPSATPSAAAEVMASCEGAGALPRGEEPCASYFATLQVGMTGCMADVANERAAWHARYLACSKLVRSAYLANGQ